MSSFFFFRRLTQIKLKKLKEALKKLKGKKVLVVGDVIVDEFLFGEVARISPEAPVPIVELKRKLFLPGGSANTANNIKSLGGTPFLVGLIGKDQTAEELKKVLKERGIDSSFLIVSNHRPTILKTRVVAHSQQVVRVDRENKESLSPAEEKEILKKVTEIISKVDAILISDYEKGVVSVPVAQLAVKESKKKGKPLIVDTKKRDFKIFKGATALTPNKSELEKMSSLPARNEEEIKKAARSLLRRGNLKAVLVTRAEEGMSLFEFQKRPYHVKAVSAQVHDVTGAGDTVAAVFSLSLAAGLDFKLSTRLANLAAGVVVRKVGTATCQPEEILTLLAEVKDKNG